MRASEKGIASSLLGLAAIALGACLLPEIGIADPDPSDAGSDAPLGCQHATYPPPPNLEDVASIPDFVVAVRSIDLGDGAGDPPGFDLDNTCTCFEDAGDTCSTKLSTPRCDGPGGVDNAASELFQLVVDNIGDGYFGSKHYSKAAEAGEWTVLFQISGYNGTPDDPEVHVTLFVSPGLEGVLANWDGMDAWPVSDDTLGPSGTLTDPLYVSDGGYVAGGTLVATLPSVEIRFSGSASTITARLVGGVVTGKLVVEPTGTRIEGGLLAARWTEQDVFAALGSFRGQGGLKLCNDGGFIYGPVKSAVCSARDILTDPVQPASSPCDALSLGIAFVADPALLGAVVPAAMPTPGCDDPMQDPANDACK
jgi:hypothetical protein